jgi:aspartyl-tRNA(Asn)/glutamyl-tRNA(Gln) amidotransferase subunit A
LTEACLRRIDQVDGRLNAFITVTAEQAMHWARVAEADIARGAYRGPLHGIPQALKDLFDTAGVRTTAGSRILADNVPAGDAAVVEHLKQAGAILLGKLNMVEFAYGATGLNPHYGPARNPWDAGRITGGSSSGSGAAVAAGECFAALGSDTGGSIRIPASLCGIVGFKPTFSRVSRRGVLPLSWSLDHVGPMARSVEDTALVLQAIAGHDAADSSCGEQPIPDYSAALDGGVKGLRLGVPRELFFEGLDAGVEAAVRSAIGQLAALGAEVREISLPHIAEAPAAVTAIMLPEALAFHQKWMAERPQDYGDDVRYRLELGATLPALHYVQAQRFREMIVEEWRREVFEHVDLLVTPTTLTAAVPLESGGLAATYGLIHNTNPFNLLGVPALSLPCGFVPPPAHPDAPLESSSPAPRPARPEALVARAAEPAAASPITLPVGLQIAGRWWDEATVLRAAHACEQATDWHTRRPPL